MFPLSHNKNEIRKTLLSGKKDQRICLLVSSEMKEELRRVAIDEECRSMNSFINDALALYITSRTE